MKHLNRWVYAAGGVMILLTAGLVYAWSILSQPIAAEFRNWSSAQLSMTFTIVMFMFCVGCTAGGVLSRRAAPGIYVRISAVLFLTGFMWSAQIHSLPALYLSFGVVNGFASGFVYNAVLGTVCRWFPDKQGLISGVLLMGFGLSSFIVGLLYQSLTPAGTGGWRTSFRVMGICIFVILIAASFFVVKPGPDFNPPVSGGKSRRFIDPISAEMTPGQMLRQGSFWLYFVWAVLLSAAGLALVSQARGIAAEVNSTVADGTIAAVVGLISVFNGIGRVIFGAMFDRYGRRGIMQAINLVFCAAGILLTAALESGSFILLTAAFAICGIAYGGVNPAHSYFVNTYYGSQNYPVNFSIIVANLLVASFGSTAAGVLYDMSRSYLSTYLMITLLAVTGIFLSAGISACDRCELRRRGK